MNGESAPASPARFESRIFTSSGPGEPTGRPRRSVLAVGVLLAAVIHAGVLFAVRWRAELAPLRERLVRVVLFAPEADTAVAEQPAVTAPAPPVSVAAPAIVPGPKRPPRPRAIEAAPALPSVATAPDTVLSQEAPVASAPAPVAREMISARPRYKSNPEPPYPVLARRRRQEGVVLLSVRVDASGKPEVVAIQTSSGFRALDDAAMAAVKNWEFEPGRLDGEPVPSQVEVPILFRLERDPTP